MEYDNYFLIVGDVVRYAKKQRYFENQIW
ncbi:hypothetical protein ACEW7V_01220 [Areca yellow leaf disease phytoplasma]